MSFSIQVFSLKEILSKEILKLISKHSFQRQLILQNNKLNI